MTALEVAGVVGLALPTAIPTLVIGWVLERRHEWNPSVRHGASVGSLFVAAVLLGTTAAWQIAALGELWVGIITGQVSAIAAAVARLLPLGLALGLGSGMMLRRLHDYEQRQHPVRGVEVQQQRLARQVEHRAGVLVRAPKVPLAIDGNPVLGAWLDGDAEECRRGNWAVLPAGHLIAIGASGSGKTTAIKQLVRSSLLGDGVSQRVVWIDGKEDFDVGIELAKSVVDAGLNPSGIRVWPSGGPIDLWRGSAQELADRFHALEEWSEPWYAAVARSAAKLAIEDPRGLPRSLDEILSRMEPAAMKATWAGTPNAEVASKLTAELLGGVRLRYHALGSALRNIGAIPEGPGGWSFEDATLVHCALPTSTTPLAAAGFGRALLIDFVSFIRNPMRRDMSVPMTCVIEELGAIVQQDQVAAASVVETLERARSAGVRMVLSGQVVASFGDPTTQARLLTSGSTILAMRMSDPEPVLNLLGTRPRPEASIGIGYDGALLDQGSMRMQDQWAVHPSVMRSLPTGRALLIRNGRYALVQVPFG